MTGIEEIEQKLLGLPLKHRVFLAESLLASMPDVGKEMSEADELTEVIGGRGKLKREKCTR